MIVSTRRVRVNKNKSQRKVGSRAITLTKELDEIGALNAKAVSVSVVHNTKKYIRIDK